PDSESRVSWANDDPDRLPGLAADLVRRRVRVIVALGSNLAVRAAKAETGRIPIVFGYGGDPVQRGHVASLNRPGGNVTGITSMSGELFGKQLGILHELLPHACRFGAFAVLKLRISSILVARSTGRSAGFSPLRMRPV